MDSTHVIKMFEVLTALLIDDECPELVADIMRCKARYEDGVLARLVPLNDSEKQLLDMWLDVAPKQREIKQYIRIIQAYQKRTGCSLLESKRQCDKYKDQMLA